MAGSHRRGDGRRLDRHGAARAPGDPLGRDHQARRPAHAAAHGHHCHARRGRFRGIRFISASDPDQAMWGSVIGRPQGLLLDRKVREGFAQLAPLGLSFDAFMFHPQLADLVDLARAFPQPPIVLNHVGGALAIGPYGGKGEEAFAEWRDGVRQVASFPNTYVKLGGLGMKLTGFTFFENDMPPSSEELEKAWRPYIETCIEAFGPKRCMFESNFPVDMGSCTNAVLWNTFKRIAANYSAAEKTALFSGTAARVYKVEI